MFKEGFKPCCKCDNSTNASSCLNLLQDCRRKMKALDGEKPKRRWTLLEIVLAMISFFSVGCFLVVSFKLYSSTRGMIPTEYLDLSEVDKDVIGVVQIESEMLNSIDTEIEDVSLPAKAGATKLFLNGTIKDECVAPETVVEKADCGTGFHKFYSGEAHSRTSGKVAFLGKFYEGGGVLSLRRYSGCPVNMGMKNGDKNPGCLNDPTCVMYIAKDSVSLAQSSVVVLTVSEAKRLTKAKTWDKIIPRKQADGTDRFRVLYAREAEVIPEDIYTYVDAVMGTYLWNDIHNPNFLIRPSTFMQRNGLRKISFAERTNFALSIISNCEPTRSERGKYIDALISHLGKSKIHRYGKCGDGRETPRKPLDAVEELFSTYKFYLSFENTIADGYVTEKLFKILTFRVIPVYMGAPKPPRITKLKSYINVHDYSSPNELAQYLEYLASNQTAYEEYHRWRDLPPEDAFDEDYLNEVSETVVSRKEYQKIVQAYKSVASNRKVNAGRVSTCCQLCNKSYLHHIRNTRKPIDIMIPWSKQTIRSSFYH